MLKTITDQQRLDLAEMLLHVLTLQCYKFENANEKDIPSNERIFPPQLTKIWTSPDKSVIRVYTGHRNEYVQIMNTGELVKSRLNMTWDSYVDFCIKYCLASDETV